MKEKTLKILNAAEAGLYSIFNVESRIAEYFGKQNITFVPEKSDSYNYRAYDFGKKYGNTTVTFTNQNKSEWKVKLEGENGGVELIESAFEKGLGLKLVSCR